MKIVHQDKDFEDVNFYSHGTRIHGRYFAARGVSKGNFLLLHGLTSNSAWFVKIAQMFSESGFNVLVYDRRGSGQSAGKKGDVPGKEAFFWDLKSAVDFMWNHSSQPIHIMSFSYAWKLAPVFLKKLKTASSRIESLVFVAPASDLRDDVKPPLKERLKVLFNWKGPYFESPVRDTDLTQNEDTLQWIRHSKDSKPLQKFTRRFLLTSVALDKDARQIMPQIKKPILVILPKDDKVIDGEKVKERFSKAPTGSKRKIVEIVGGHIVDTEDAQRDLATKVLDWVKTNHPVVH